MFEEKTVREAAVAGQFYAGTRESLIEQIESCYEHPLGPGAVPSPLETPLKHPCGFVVPHAGYVYSGHVAAHTYAAMAAMGKPEVVVLLGPNHHALNPPLALSPASMWKTPLGELEVDSDLGKRIEHQVSGAEFREVAHRLEHSIEVELPFLQHLYGTFPAILPIAVADQSVQTAIALGEALADALEGSSAVVLASSDFSHYLTAEAAAELDRHALDAILDLDAERLGHEVNSRGLTMCGWGPVMAMLECMKRLGATEARLLKYANSGDISGDRDYVVAYAAVRVGPA